MTNSPKKPSDDAAGHQPSERPESGTRPSRPAPPDADRISLPGFDRDVRPHAAGDIISGKYELVSLLGEGGMGAVWLAHNLTLDVDVALKLIKRSTGAGGSGGKSPAANESTQRLLQEARAAARLGHPSIVRVLDFGFTEEREPFLVMELLEGETLSQLLERKSRLSATHAVALLLPVIDALGMAHAKQIIHRDLKPENIFLCATERGTVPKIVDFGIAKLRRDDVNRHVTQAGALMGTPDYMSPEQARGRGEVDERADIWALGVVLYECITGRRPFDGDGYHALLTAIQHDDPVPTTEHAAGDAALWAVIQRALHRDVAARWQSMRDFGQALAEWGRKNGVDEDVTGASISSVWSHGPRRSLSSAPASLSFGGPPSGRMSHPTLDGPPATQPAPMPRKSSRLAWLVAPAAILAGVAFFALRTPTKDASTASTAELPVTRSPAAHASETLSSFVASEISGLTASAPSAAAAPSGAPIADASAAASAAASTMAVAPSVAGKTSTAKTGPKPPPPPAKPLPPPKDNTPKPGAPLVPDVPDF